MKKSINEKIVAVTGRDNWSTAKACGLPSLRVSDGPHGLRFVTEEKDGEQIAAESVCYPTLSALGNSFDESLVYAVGQAIAEDCIKHVTRGAGVDGINEVCAYPLGVAGVTGVDSFEVITALNRQLSPDIIICVDALCAIKRERICRAYQLSSAGIRAGGGTENPSDKKINFKSMGVPVVAIGVPTVISAQLAVKEITGENERADEYFSGGDMFVTLRDIDLAVNECAEVVSSALNLALSPETYFLHNS